MVVLPPHGNGSYDGFGDLLRRLDVEGYRTFHGDHRVPTSIHDASDETTDEQLRMFLSEALQ